MQVDPTVAEINRIMRRKLRVLHIGNIANNAYNNARIQRQYGIEADVLCHDYYHVMATPEWEDGGLTTNVDPNFPNWWESNLKGFRRPEWYVQGPRALCLDYLDAHRRGQKLRRWITAIAIEDAYSDLLRLEATLRRKPWRNPHSFWSCLGSLPFAEGRQQSSSLGTTIRAIAGCLLAAGKHLGSHVIVRIMRAPLTLKVIPVNLRRSVLWPLLVAAVCKPPRIKGASLILGMHHFACMALGRNKQKSIDLAHYAAEQLPPKAKFSWLATLTGVISLMLQGLLLALFSILVLPFYWLSYLTGHINRPQSLHKRHKLASQIASALLDGQTGDSSCNSEFKKHIEQYLSFGPLLKHYDVIQGYSISGIIPLANHHPAFASYEHGTLRKIPFEDSLTGLICRVAYRNSPAVFVTNTDVLPSVERLGLDPARVHYLPHAFDDQKLMQWRDTHPELAPPGEEVVFFSPTRQHWRDTNLSLTKGNDIMLRAAGLLWADGRRFQLILVEWGNDIAEIKKANRRARLHRSGALGASHGQAGSLASLLH